MHWRILAVTAFEFKMSLPTQQLQMPKKGWPYSTRLAFIISSQFERNLATCWEVKAFDLPIENFCTKLVKSWEVFFVGLLFIKNFDEPCQGEVGNAKETFNAANFYRSWKNWVGDLEKQLSRTKTGSSLSRLRWNRLALNGKDRGTATNTNNNLR